MRILTAVTAFAIGFGCIATAADSPKQHSDDPCTCVLLASNGKPAEAQQSKDNGSQLESVLNSMDKAAASFKTVQSKFQWDQYTKLVDETDTQNGTIYYHRRDNSSVEMGAHIEKPDTRIVVFSDGLVRIYFPRADEIREYPAGKNKETFESFLVLGFGGRGHDLAKSFEVQYDGSETVDGVNTARLALVPKEAGVKNMFNRIVLWIDLERGISIQQKLFQPNGDFRLARYSDIKMNQKLPDDAFKIKTTKKTKVVAPNS